MGRLVRALVVGAVATVLVATAVAAQAATRVFPERRPDTVPSIDVRSLHATNGVRTVRLTAKMPDFRRADLDAIVFAVQPRVETGPLYVVSVARGDDGRFTKRLTRDAGEPLHPNTLRTAADGLRRGDELDDVRIRCGGLAVTWRARSVSVSVPQSCLGANRSRIAVAAATVGRDPAPDDDELDVDPFAIDVVPEFRKPRWIAWG